MSSQKWWGAALLILLLLLGGCERASRQTDAADDGLIMTMEISPDPPTVGESELRIILTDKAGNPIDGAKLAIKGDMSHAGMTPVLANVNESESGVYTVPFQWTMGGDWIVSVVAELAEGGIVTRRFDLSVGGNMNMQK